VSELNPSKAKRLLLIFRHTPYGSGLARAGLDMALACGAFEQDVTVLFMGDGVLQLQQGQEAHQIGRKDIARQLASLSLYDVENLFVDAQSADRYGITLDDHPLATTLLSAPQIRELMNECDHILGF
jgi:tRNA 2-thiouridine synthesizing protein C